MRPDKDEYFLCMALVASTRSTCSRRKVGAVATDDKGHIISTGYNGAPKESPHCNELPCPAVMAASNTELDGCRAIHAEINTIAHCTNPQSIHTMYIQCTPCMSCMKAIIATGCRRIVASNIYCENALHLFDSVGGSHILIPE